MRDEVESALERRLDKQKVGYYCPKKRYIPHRHALSM